MTRSWIVSLTDAAAKAFAANPQDELLRPVNDVLAEGGYRLAPATDREGNFSIQSAAGRSVDDAVAGFLIDAMIVADPQGVIVSGAGRQSLRQPGVSADARELYPN
jgi:hypothetical protein